MVFTQGLAFKQRNGGFLGKVDGDDAAEVVFERAVGLVLVERAGELSHTEMCGNRAGNGLQSHDFIVEDQFRFRG